MATPDGLEPPRPVLETGALPVELKGCGLVCVLRFELRAPNVGKRVPHCDQNRWWRGGRGVSYREYERRVRQSQRRFWVQPGGLARVLPQGFVAGLVNIRDIHFALLRALKQNRASATQVS